MDSNLNLNANLYPPHEAFNPDMPSHNDLMVDSEEHIVEPTQNDAEKDSLTIINPDSLETEEEKLPDLPRADDCMWAQTKSCTGGGNTDIYR